MADGNPNRIYDLELLIALAEERNLSKLQSGWHDATALSKRLR